MIFRVVVGVLAVGSVFPLGLGAPEDLAVQRREGLTSFVSI